MRDKVWPLDRGRRLPSSVGRRLAALAVCAFVVAVPGRGSVAAQGGELVPGAFDVQASEIVAQIVDGRFAEVRDRFDATMLDALSEEGLGNAWRTYQELLGTLQSAGQPTSVMRGDLTVEQVPVQLARSTGEIRIVFHPDGTLAGLFFLVAGVPVP